MPLHDWTDDRGWDGVQLLWIHSLLCWLQDRLPVDFRAYLGSVPMLQEELARFETAVEGPQPDFQVVGLNHPEPLPAAQLFHQGKLIAAIELVSPRNKDRPSSREFYRNRYLGYLWSGVHLMLVDVHRRPLGFSFVEAMAAELQCQLPVGLPPHAVSWNVGGPTPEGGRFMDGWQRTLTVGQPLPTLPLSLTADRSLLIDLEFTYSEAARRAYLE
jgi:hypothetical protein